jgi:hypothetical protein
MEMSGLLPLPEAIPQNKNPLPTEWRYCAINRKAADSFLDGIFEILHWINPSGRTVTLESTQPIEMNTKDHFRRGGGGEANVAGVCG